MQIEQKIDMLRTYWKVAWRNLLKNRGFALINTLGLSGGIAFSLLIGAYIWGEVQVNRSLRHAGRQYILQSRWKDPNTSQANFTSGLLPKELRQQYPSLVRNYYRWDGISSTVSRGDKHFREALQIGDTTLLAMYGFALAQGDAATAMKGPFSVVISHEAALKYFGKENAVGQALTIDNFSGARHDFQVTGVLEPFGRNSVFNIGPGIGSSFFLPTAAAGFFNRNLDDWNNFNIPGYVELQPGVAPEALIKPMQAMLKTNADPQISANVTIGLTPLTDYYLQANNGAVRRMIGTLTCIALFILLMAGVNFVNLSISRSATRLKEIGVRKVLGSVRRQLIAQFLIESVLMAQLAMMFSLGLYLALRPLATTLLDQSLPPLSDFPVWFAALPLGLALAIGVLAGLYPAIYLSSLPSIDSLKGKLTVQSERIWMRKSLVAFQFGTAITVFIGSILIAEQVRVFFGKGLGYEKDFVIYAPLPRDWSAEGVSRMESNRYRFSQLSAVQSASLSYEIPNGNNQGNVQVYREAGSPGQAIACQLLTTDGYFSGTYGIPMEAGQFFTPIYRPADSTKVVINAAHAKALGWPTPREAIGQNVYLTFMGTPLVVCGVTRDFYFGSMQSDIKPVLFLNVNYNPSYRYMSFKLRPGSIEEGLAAVQKEWAALMPGAPFEYVFMDDALASLYKTEIRLKRAAQAATGLAIGIVLLGVLGLIALSIQKREKEIGVRKVLGASVPAIVGIFMEEFLWIVLVAGALACPLVYLLARHWLNGYAYRITITPWPFAAAIVALAALTALLIALQTIRVATANPVRSLRNE